MARWRGTGVQGGEVGAVVAPDDEFAVDDSVVWQDLRDSNWTSPRRSTMIMHLYPSSSGSKT